MMKKNQQFGESTVFCFHNYFEVLYLNTFNKRNTLGNFYLDCNSQKSKKHLYSYIN